MSLRANTLHFSGILCITVKHIAICNWPTQYQNSEPSLMKDGHYAINRQKYTSSSNYGMILLVTANATCNFDYIFFHTIIL